MESLNPQVVAAAKLPILNPNEFDLWKMRTKQYFLMTDYSFWKVILNEQRLANKNELKTRGTLLMALPDNYPLKFNIHKDAKTLMEAIEKRLGDLDLENKADLEEQSLDDLFNNLKIYEADVKGSSTSSQNSQNIAFVSSNNTNSTNVSVNAVLSVSAASSKATVSTLLNVDSLTDAVIYSFFASQSNSPQLDNEDLKQIDPEYFEEINLKWQMAMLTMRARRFRKRTGSNLGANGTDTIRFDMSKVECYNCHKRGYFARECRSPRDNRNKEATRRLVPTEVSTSNDLVSQCDVVGSSSSSGSDNEVAPYSKSYSKAYATLQTHYDNLTVEFRKSQFGVLSYKTSLKPVEARLVVYQKNENVFEEDIKLLKLNVMLRDNTLVELRKNFEKAKKERDDLKLTLEKFQISSKNLKLHSHESDNSVPKHLENDRYKTCEGYHVVLPLYTGTFMHPKPNLVFNDAPNASETIANMFNVESSTNKPRKDMSKTHRSDAPIIEDWISDFEDETENESVPKQKEPSFVPTTKHVKTHRESVKQVEHPKQAENLRTYNQQSRGHKKNWNKKACFICRSLNHLIKDCDYYKKWNVVPTAVLTRSRLVPLNAARPVLTDVPQSTGNPQQALKDKGVIDSGYSRHMTGNISFLLDFEEINGRYVSFEGKPKGGKISGKGKIKTGKLDLDDVYFVNELKFNLFSVSQMCDKKNSILFIDTECIVLSSDYKLPDENHVLLRVPRENNM
nr:ribonuclease H-like domain-containing protein [Tanacetum cinerariifolium]